MAEMFKNEWFSRPIADRQKDSNDMLKKYNNRVPVIVIPSNDDIVLTKYKYLFKRDCTIASMMLAFRNYVDIDESQALFIFINNTLPPQSSTISSIYESNKSEDGFLYVYCSKESTFGNNL